MLIRYSWMSLQRFHPDIWAVPRHELDTLDKQVERSNFLFILAPRLELILKLGKIEVWFHYW